MVSYLRPGMECRRAYPPPPGPRREYLQIDTPGRTGNAADVPHEATSLLERERELSGLTRIVADAANGDGRIVIIEGEAGVGKTALLDAAAGTAREHGMRVLAARGATLERDFAHGVARQLFEVPVMSLGARERRDLLKGPAEVAAALLGWEDRTDADAPATTDAAFAAVHGLYWLAANLATQTPLLLVVDDAQWADIASLRWLNYLAHGRLGGVPVCVLITWRTGEPDAPEDLLRSLRSEPEVQHIVARRLSASASADLLRRILGGSAADDGLCALCHERTGGNPFLLVELARALEAEGIDRRDEWQRLAARLGPETIRQTMLLRLARLPAEAAALARAVAILDSDAATRHAAGLADLSPTQLGAQADLLSAAGVLMSGPTLRFAHPILRTVIYEDMTPPARAIGHRRAADLLAAAGAPDQAAIHLVHSDPAGDASVVEVLRQTARRHLVRGAPDAAVPLLARALAEPPQQADRSDVQYELGHAELVAGRPEAVEHLRDAYDTADESRLRVTAARELAGALAAGGHADEALEVLRGLADGLADSPDLAVSVEAAAAAIAQVSGRLRGRYAERLQHVAARAPGDTAAGRRLLVTFAYSGVANGEMTAAEVAELIDRASASGDVFDDEEAAAALSPSLPWAIACEIAVERLDRATAHARQELIRGRARGSPLSVLTCAGYLARLAYLRADVRGAEVEARVALQAAEAIAPTYYLDWPVSQLALILVELDRPKEALDVLERNGFAGSTLPRDLFAAHFLTEARIATWSALGRLDRAAADAELLWKLGRGRSSPLLARRGVVAEALLAAGRRDRAREVAEAEVRAAAGWGLPSARGAALRVRGLVEGGSDGRKLLARSVTELDDTAHRLDLARALIDLGTALRLGREPSRAREPLSRGLEIAASGGAVALAERARTELRLTGARPQRDAGSRLDVLTAAERRVAELVAAGHGNDAVAQSLFVTRRTVETHLTSVYRKLGISARGMLAEALARART